MKTFRHLLIKDWDQKKLDNTRVMIAGAGAIGSQLATILARLNISMVVVDNDKLEEHNIGNQVYTRKHLGLSKVEALRAIVRDVSDVDYKGIKSFIQDIQTDKYEVDVFLGAIDNLAARFYLNAVSVFSGKPYIDAGIEGYRGSVRTVFPQRTSCLQCWPTLNKEVKVKGCSQEPIPSIYFSAGHTANIQTMQLLNIIFKNQIQAFITFDLEKGTFATFNLAKNKECDLCNS